MDLEIMDKLVAMLGVAAQNTKARHWTLKGTHFKSWHLLLDEIYKKLSDGLDVAAEIIIQRNGIPVHSLTGFLELSPVKDMLLLGDWRRYVSDTATELKTIIDFINEWDGRGAFDGAASNDLTQLASDLYHYYMFANQTLKEE